MIAKKNKLTRKEIEEIYKGKKKSLYFSFEQINIKKTLNEENYGPKFAIIVSKKVAKKAVIRNRIRRKIYAIIASILKTQTLQDSFIFQVKNISILEKANLLKLLDILNKLNN